jgi:hypothetical protein
VPVVLNVKAYTQGEQATLLPKLAGLEGKVPTLPFTLWQPETQFHTTVSPACMVSVLGEKKLLLTVTVWMVA